MISPGVKDIIDVVGALGTPIAIISGLYGFWRWTIKTSISAHDSKAEAKLAMGQINTMATNCFPTMQRKLIEIADKTDEGNKSLGEIATNTAILVDRHKEG